MPRNINSTTGQINNSSPACAPSSCIGLKLTKLYNWPQIKVAPGIIIFIMDFILIVPKMKTICGNIFHMYINRETNRKSIKVSPESLSDANSLKMFKDNIRKNVDQIINPIRKINSLIFKADF